ncbi:hypoxanthine phosphoribosyltransferase [Oribacterium sp. NK2B42]|uniref:hypoxanthine phosphoribosyltransferase n=1 Tax=Oribacterium sp. NK2B42 TaxID=689781 RepID=UPI0004024E1A|nr:hypoxanthine phosphoribosyltransferase [Oribacterium sp. NK2B42]MBO5597275.1 hypoxanthine phosphoribosyltransferase [Oribacterium sp.]MBO6307341.1 hypoxanthine phosphoribosyltransferase [Oribacterium sp.]MBP3803791.1 hypoxanthine phosphoribosyltransferase [Oribacterium sp.]MBR1857748.1 hypoxanthine phosphoribosyltransferase [Oribacterium sp.]
MAEHVRVLIPEDEIRDKIIEVADKISEAYKGESLHLICILKGGAMFMCELAKRIHDVNISFDFMSVSSYGAGTTTSGIVKIVKDLDEPLEGKNVLIVEDIIDTGHTLNHLSKLLMSRGPKSIEICTLLNKPSRREKEVPVKYSCFEIPDEFVVGYGLDYDQKYRNLPYIGVVEFD